MWFQKILFFSNHEFKSNFRKKNYSKCWNDIFNMIFSLASDLNDFFLKSKTFPVHKVQILWEGQKIWLFFKLFSSVIMFGLSEKHTKICEIFPMLCTFKRPNHEVDFFKFVCFSESPNFKKVWDFFKFVCPSQNIWTLIRFLDHS